MPRSKKRLADQETTPETAPVATGRLPVVSCALCPAWARAYDPKETTGSEVLTGHYNDKHIEELTSA